MKRTIACRLICIWLIAGLPLLSAAQKKFSATVVDSVNAPVSGANVINKRSNAGAQTAANGVFSINASIGETLTISAVGYETKDFVIRSIDGPFSIVLSKNASTLSDVIVVGYGTQKRINVSGAVSQVSGEVLEDRPLTNLGAGLQGVVPNLQINAVGNAPGQGSSFNIRGLTSVNGGVPLVLVDGVQQDPNLINPSDVASVTVLKDAAAAAIYGGRAAFGVVLITTKNGKKNQKPTLKLSSSYTSNRATLVPKYMNSLDYINYMDTASINAGSGAYFSQRIRDGVTAYIKDPAHNPTVLYDPNIDKDGKYQYVGNTDWASALYRPGFLLQDNVSLSGGGNNMTYYLSYGFMQQQGLLRAYKDMYTRHNLTASVSSDVLKWLTVTGRVKYASGNEDHPGGGIGFTGVSAYSGIGQYSGQLKGDLRPLMPIRHPDGNFAGQGNFTNPFAVSALGGSYKVRSSDVWLTGAVQIRPLSGLNVNVDYTFNPYSNNSTNTSIPFREYHADGSYNIYPWTNPSRVRLDNNNNYYYAFNAYADYSRSFGKHNLKLLAGYNQEKKDSNEYSAQRLNLVINDQPSLGLATGTTTVGQANSSWAVMGVFGRLNYDFDNKYFLEFNTRYDGSSRFASGRRFVVLPSASVAWRVSKEKFWDNSILGKIAEEFKLRGSFGELGNQYVNSNFPYLSFFNVNTSLPYIIGSGTSLPVSVSPGQLVSPNFTWEKVSQWNAGLDAEFLSHRLELSADIYTRYTNGMLVPGQPLPAVLGAAVPQENAANLRTNGFELSIKWHEQINKDLSYHLAAVLSNSSGRITKYNNPTGDLGSYYAGQKWGEIWGYVSDGLFQSYDEIASHADQSLLFGGKWNPGDVKYVDISKSGKIGPGANTLSDHGSQKVIGNSTQRYQYSFMSGVRWKTFDLDLMLQGVGKADFVPDGRFYGIGSEWDVPMVVASNFWSYGNRGGYLPRPYIDGGHGNRSTSTRYLQSAAYLRVKQISIGYSLPENVANKIAASQLRIFVTGQNLFTFTKLSKLYDPENLYNNYPLYKALLVGVNITFK